MNIPYFHVDAFVTDQPFSGNPAGVCLLEQWLPDELMQKIAFENNHAETAFVVKESSAWRVRWFSPKAEVDLCGHATLAAASVLFREHPHTSKTLEFTSRSGPLSVEQVSDRYVLDFPGSLPKSVSVPSKLIEGLDAKPTDVLQGRFLIAVFETEDQVKQLRPNLAALETLETFAVLATAPGTQSDYVLRCFGPKVGIPEDPATGSAQSDLAPYWGKRLWKRFLQVRQLSNRGAEMTCELRGDRVHISGRAVTYLQGMITL